jgi:hypothetical protein
MIELIGLLDHPIDLVSEVYNPSAIPAEIDPEISKHLGRLLVVNGYERENGLVVNKESVLTVSALLREFDKDWEIVSAERQALAKDKLFGPYYFYDGQDEFCQLGVAIWSPVEVHLHW